MVKVYKGTARFYKNTRRSATIHLPKELADMLTRFGNKDTLVCTFDPATSRLVFERLEDYGTVEEVNYPPIRNRGHECSR